MNFYKTVVLLAAITGSLTLRAQEKPLKSGVYKFSDMEEIKPEPDKQLRLLRGSTTMLSDLDIIVTSLDPGQKSKPEVYPDKEVMIIVELGKVKINAGSQSKV